MTRVREIKERFLGNLDLASGMEIHSDVFVTWLDEAQLEVAKYYGPVVHWDLPDVEAGEEYDLPEACLRIWEVRDGDGNFVYEWEVTEQGTFILPRSGDYHIYYHKVPDLLPVNDEEVELEVHQIFHLSLHKYCLYKYWSRTGEGIDTETAYAKMLLEEFYNDLTLAARNLRLRARRREKIRVGEELGLNW